MDFMINPLKWNNSFAVPSEVVDKHIRLAGSVQLKVLLWMMRHSAEEKNMDEMSKDLGVSVADCSDALTFWSEMGLLVATDKTFAPEKVAEKVPEPVVETKKQETKRILPEIEAIKPTAQQIAARGDESEEIRFLFNEAQMRLGKTIGHDGQAVLLMMHDSYGLPVEVIVTIIEYCVSVGKTSTSYIAKIGKDWGEREIDSLEKADEVINELKASDEMWGEFRLRTGVSTPRPTTAQMKYLNRWKNEYGFTMDMIFLAYEETANNIQKMSFQYMDRILKNWFENGLRTPADVAKAKQERSVASQQNIAKSENKHKKKTSYNIDEVLRKNEETELVYKRKGDNV
ncbi:MAG: DnaD domain protein [Ruminococcaceae bacterium]|nr:DnaD domain protein [Oscillospiraceae bacterium]